MTLNGTLAGTERIQQLSERLAQEGALSIVKEARRFSVHEMTIRRDFESLELQGLARRVRGGIVLPQGDVFSVRMHQAKRAKEQIARKLQSLVPDDSAIGVDASTTLVYFVRGIRASGLSVVTNGWTTFDELNRRSGVRAFLTGGESEEHNASLVGPLAVRSIEGFHFSRIFLSATSLAPDSGTSEPTLLQAEVKRAMVTVGSHVVVAVDSSKLDTTSAVRALSFTDIDLLVTELDPSDSRLDAYRDSIELL